MERITEPQIYQFLSHYGTWEYSQDGELETHYEFEDFLEAMSFVNDLVEVCERLEHHPTITITYNTVHLATATHDAWWAITQKDLDLIEAIEEVVE